MGSYLWNSSNEERERAAAAANDGSVVVGNVVAGLYDCPWPKPEDLEPVDIDDIDEDEVEEAEEADEGLLIDVDESVPEIA